MVMTRHYECVLVVFTKYLVIKGLLIIIFLYSA